MGSIYMTNPVPVKYVGKCIPCNRPVTRPFGDSLYRNAQDIISCPDCNGKCVADLMYGAINRMSCDDRCMGAYGKECVCGCGGVNHGGVWSEVITDIPAHIVEAYHKDQESRKKAAQTKADNKAAANISEFTSWAVEYADDVMAVRAYTGNNSFILDAQAKVLDLIILQPNYLSAVIRVIKEESERVIKELEKRRAALNSVHQGNEGEVIYRDLTVTDIINIKDIYAVVPRGSDIPTKPLYKFTDADGNVYIWFASKYQVNIGKDGTFGVNDGWKVNDTFSVSAKIKKHDEYEGIKQTVINYVKVVK